MILLKCGTRLHESTSDSQGIAAGNRGKANELFVLLKRFCLTGFRWPFGLDQSVTL